MKERRETYQNNDASHLDTDPMQTSQSGLEKHMRLYE